MTEPLNLNEFFKFPSLESFRHVVAHVRKRCDYHGVPYPKLRYFATVKLHGTNAGIRLLEDGTLVAQSRSRDLTPEDDNAGFAAFVVEHAELIRKFLFNNKPGVVFGEWCGGNIQKGVALNQLQKQFVVFAATDWSEEPQLVPFLTFFVVRADGTHDLVEIENPCVDIDFARPDEVVATFEELTSETEDECPYAAHYGVKGIGEGLVWTPGLIQWDTVDHPLDWTCYDSRLWFKTKGEKHGNAAVKSTVKVRVQADRVDDMNALVAEICPEWRLQQGVTELAAQGVEREKKNTGAYLKWIATDVLKEQKDMIEASGFESGIVMGEISKIARIFWFKEAV